MPWLSSFKGYLQPRVLLIAGLGVLSGLPLGLLVDPLRYWLSEIGIEKSTIGLLSLVMLSYSLKMFWACLLYTSPSPRDLVLSRMPSSA